jgi:hypothetical protein
MTAGSGLVWGFTVAPSPDVMIVPTLQRGNASGPLQRPESKESTD